MINYVANLNPFNLANKHSILATGNFNSFEMINIAAEHSLNDIPVNTDKFIYVLNGEGDLRTLRKIHTLIPGEMITIKAGEPLLITAVTNMRLLLLH
jgi:mannose-6-phosphate isomerase-like protein (cupin superfamily)